MYGNDWYYPPNHPMVTLMNIRLRLTIIFIVLLTLGGCVKKGETKNTPPPPPVKVSISLFKCNCDPATQEAVREAIIDELFTYTNAIPIKSGKADVIFDGAITIQNGAIGYSNGFVGGNDNGFAGGKNGGGAAGTYMSGLSIEVYKDGELIATHSVGQDLSGGKRFFRRRITLISPVSMTKDAAYYVAKLLVQKKVLVWK
jgi:hypothetical protein